MEYVVKKKPNDFVICTCSTEREARILISGIESQDVRNDTFEPDTYCIEERAIYER